MKRAYGLIWLFTCVLLLAPAKAGAQSVPGVVSIENEVLSRYLNDSDYDTADYTYTNMDKYVPPRSGQYDKPDHPAANVHGYLHGISPFAHTPARRKAKALLFSS